MRVFSGALFLPNQSKCFNFNGDGGAVSKASLTLVTPWTVAHQAPLCVGFSRQKYWSGLPVPSAEDLPDPGIEPRFPALRADALPSEPPGKPIVTWELVKNANSQGTYQKLWV